jgi:hypothetical protein
MQERKVSLKSLFTNLLFRRQHHDGKLQNHVTKPASFIYQSVRTCRFLKCDHLDVRANKNRAETKDLLLQVSAVKGVLQK